MSVVNDLIEEVRRLAAESPDKVAACEYVDSEDQPVCIMGHAFRNLGLEAVEGFLADNQEAGATLLAAECISDLEDAEWLDYAQCFQDQGNDWGTAVALADRECG